MQRATLWNSPLFMVLLAGIYKITGESQMIARFFSFVLAIGVVYLFFRMAIVFEHSKKRALTIICILILDLTFIRSANTARMDMLTLFWIILTLLILIIEHKHHYHQDHIFSQWPSLLFISLRRKSRFLFYMAGICTGLAATSHPIAILLIPIWLIFTFPRLRALVYGSLGTLTGLLPWLVYIVLHHRIFLTQFSMQIKRKQDIFRFFGGDTGGVFKVFFSQYGAGKILMLLALGWMILTIFFITHNLIKSKKEIFQQGWKNLQFRLFGIFFVVLALVIFSSEGWYALYITPFLLILLFSQEHGKVFIKFDALKLQIHSNLALFFFILCIFFIREWFFWKKSESIPERQQKTIQATSNCNSIYLRIRPDPYFELSKSSPEKRILEFIPGKLVLPEKYSDLSNTYDQIDCFVLNDHHDWEPKLKIYLLNNNHYFQKTILNDVPLERATVWKRKNIHN